MRRLVVTASSLTVLSIVVGFSAPGLVAQDLRPPVATMKPKVDTLHGEIRTDNYFWIREKTNPDVIALETEPDALLPVLGPEPIVDVGTTCFFSTPMFCRGSSLLQRKSRRNLGGNLNSNPSTQLSRAPGNGIRSFLAAIAIKR